MRSLGPRIRGAALDAFPWLLLSMGMFAASTRAIQIARANSAVSLPRVADLSLLTSAVYSPTACLIVAVCSAAIAWGISRRSHVQSAMGQLVATAIVYFRVMDTWMEPLTGIVDTRLWSAVMWLYMPQSVAIVCFASHVAITYRRARAGIA